MYKVMFANNKAVSTIEMTVSGKVRVEIEHIEDKKVLKSITVFAPNALDGINVANNIALYVLDE